MLVPQKLALTNNRALVAGLAITLCSVFFIVYNHHAWSRRSTPVEQVSPFMQTRNSVQQIQNEVTDLNEFKAQFENSLSKIENWMSSVSPSQKMKEIQKARKAQLSLFDYLTKELKNIEHRFKEVPTFAHLRKLDEEVAKRQRIIQAYEDIARNRKAKVIIKNI